jgi:hypothetical protein
LERKSRSQVLIRTTDSYEEIAMFSKLAIAALAAGSLLGTVPLASAQNDYGQPAASGTAEAGAGTSSHVRHHKMKSSHLRTGTTTGMSHRSSTAKSRPGGEPTSYKPAK